MKNARTLAVHIVAPWPISASTGAPGMDEARPLLGGGGWGWQAAGSGPDVGHPRQGPLMLGHKVGQEFGRGWPVLYPGGNWPMEGSEGSVAGVAPTRPKPG